MGVIKSILIMADTTISVSKKFHDWLKSKGSVLKASFPSTSLGKFIFAIFEYFTDFAYNKLFE